jgi:hypothetical protein
LKDKELDKLRAKLKVELSKKLESQKRLSKRYLTFEPLEDSKTDAKTDLTAVSGEKKRKRGK